mgnify:CR=1 FL=1
MTFGEKLRFLREVRGLSKTELAIATGFSRRSIYNWEAGKRQPKSLAVLTTLGVVLGVDLGYWTPSE